MAADTTLLNLTISGSGPTPEASTVEGTVRVSRTPDGAVAAYDYTLNGEHWIHWPGVASYVFSRLQDEVRALAHPPASTRLIRETFHRFVLLQPIEGINAV